MEYLISDLILCVAGLSGRTDKITRLMEGVSKMSPEQKATFETFLNYVFRVDYSYGVTFDPTVHIHRTKSNNTLDDLFSLFDRLRSRELSGQAALDAVYGHMTRASSESLFHVGKMILNRTLDCGIDKKTILKLFPAVLPFTPAMMKCEPADEKTLKKAVYPGMLQLKIDAMRVNAETNGESCDFWTYNGTQFNIESEDLIAEIEALRRELAPKYGTHLYLDGELQIYSLGKPLPRKKSNGQANRILKGTAPVDVHENSHIVLWDVLPAEAVVAKVSTHSNIERFTDLKAAMERLNLKYLHLVEHYTVSSEDEINEHTFRWIEAGEEGSVFKNSDAPWEGKRSAHCLKFKAKRQCELRVVDWLPGEGKYEGMIGSLVCTSEDGGLVVDIGVGLTDDDRALPFDEYRNKVIAVYFNEVITNVKNPDKYSLFLARYIEIRVDKDEADTTEVIKAAKALKKEAI